MSTTVSYKGQTLATVSNQTKTLLTEGKYLEDDITLTDVSGGGATLITKNISANGTYNASSDSADGYSQVTVAVPNTYSAGDEGKVVSNGALVAQSSDTCTQNGTVDTTLINSLLVNVSGGTTPTGFVSEKVINTTEGVTSGSNNSLSLMQTLEPDLLENGNRGFYLFFFLDNTLTNKKAVFAWCVHNTDSQWMYGSCRMNTGGTMAWIASSSHDFWYSSGTEIHILKFNSQLGME